MILKSYFSTQIRKEGPVTEEIIYNKYNEIYENQRFENGFEQKSIWSLNLYKKFNYKNLNYSIGLDLIDWENYMFYMENSDPNSNNSIKKLSLNFAIFYNVK